MTFGTFVETASTRRHAAGPEAYDAGNEPASSCSSQIEPSALDRGECRARQRARPSFWSTEVACLFTHCEERWRWKRGWRRWPHTRPIISTARQSFSTERPILAPAGVKIRPRRKHAEGLADRCCDNDDKVIWRRTRCWPVVATCVSSPMEATRTWERSGSLSAAYKYKYVYICRP